MLNISTVRFIDCPATTADDVGGLMLQDCATVARAAIMADGGIHSGRLYRPIPDALEGATARIAALVDGFADTQLPKHHAFIRDCWAMRDGTGLPTPRVILDVTGGMVQGASIDIDTQLDIVVVDYDNDDEDDADFLKVPNEKGRGTTPASAVELGSMDVNPAWVGKVYAALDARDAAAE